MNILKLNLFLITFLIGLTVQSVSAKSAIASISINGDIDTVVINQATTSNIQVHLEANDDIGKNANFYIIGFAASNGRCLAFDIGLESDVCGYLYRGLEDQWSAVPLGNTYTGSLQSFQNFIEINK